MDNPSALTGQRKAVCRVLRLLVKYRDDGIGCKLEGSKYRLSGNSSRQTFPRELCEQLDRIGLIRLMRSKERMQITEIGELRLKLLLHPDASVADFSRDIRQVKERDEFGTRSIRKNFSESPLTRLRFRKSANGRAFLDDHHFRAGERFREDFEKGQMQPKITANWEAPVAVRSRSARNQASELSDFALDIRARLNEAINYLGPELSGVVLDVCCFLKGMETVERERRWPPRSAKLMLKTALDQLARFYGLDASAVSRSASIRTWATSDYRPKINR